MVYDSPMYNEHVYHKKVYLLLQEMFILICTILYSGIKNGPFFFRIQTLNWCNFQIIAMILIDKFVSQLETELGYIWNRTQKIEKEFVLQGCKSDWTLSRAFAVRSNCQK